MSLRPTRSSRARICRLTAGCVTPSRAAAWEKLRRSTTAQNAASWRVSISRPYTTHVGLAPRASGLRRLADDARGGQARQQHDDRVAGDAPRADRVQNRHLDRDQVEREDGSGEGDAVAAEQDDPVATQGRGEQRGEREQAEQRDGDA